MNEEIEVQYEYEMSDEEDLKESMPEDQELEEFKSAVDTLLNLDNFDKDEEEPAKKKAKVEENLGISDREIVHRMMGCRHCRSRFGHEEDITIHRRIDEIFNQMKQTVK